MKNFTTICILICCSFLFLGKALSQDVGLTPNELSKMFTPNNIGTEFYLSLPPIKLDSTKDKTFNLYGVELYLYSPVTADVEIKVVSSNFQLPAGIIKVRVKPFEPTIIPQSQLPFQFVAPYADPDGTPNFPNEKEFFSGRAINVKSTAPIAVYMWFKNREFNEGYVAIPKSSTHTEYVIGSSVDLGTAVMGIPQPSFITIIGQDANPTQVTATIGGRLGTNSGLGIGSVTSVQLSEGDVSFIVGKSGGELTGTKLVGNRPFIVLTGNLCAFIPESGTCNTAIEMPVPSRTWGKNYYVPKLPSPTSGYRSKQTLTRVFSKELNTAILVDNTFQGQLGTDGTQAWSTGTWQELPVNRASANNHKGYLISSDKPVTVTGYGTSKEDDNQFGTNPFQFQVVPVEQFQTIQMIGKVSSLYSYVGVVVTELNTDESFPVDLEYSLLDPNTKKLVWIPVTPKFINEKQVFDTPTNGVKYGSMNIYLDAAATAFRSSKPFAVYSIGYNSEGSTAYAGSMGLKDLTKPLDTLPPTVRITDSTCGYRNVQLNISDKAPNNQQSSLQDPFLNTAFSFNYIITTKSKSDASGVYLVDVVDMWKDAKAVVSVSDVIGNDTTVYFNYVAPDPNPMTNFADLSMTTPIIFDQGVPFEFKVKLKNSTVKPINIPGLVLQNNNPNYTVKAGQFPRTLAPQEMIDVIIICNTIADGLFIDSLGYDICGKNYFFSFLQTRIGTPNLKVGNQAFTQIDAAFGSIQVSTQSFLDFEMRNIGTGIVKFTKNSFTLPTQAEFSVQLKNPTNVFNTIDEYFAVKSEESLRPNEFITVRVTFSPTSAIKFIDSMLVSSNSKNNDSIARMDGTGTSSLLQIAGRFPLGGLDWRRCYYLDPSDAKYRLPNVVSLINKGTAPLRILNLYPKSNSAIELEINGLTQYLIQPNDSVVFASTFYPLAPGFYTGEFVVVTDTDTLEFNINGIGTNPILLVEPFLQFGEVFISNNSNNKLRPLTITNRNYEFSDTVCVIGLTYDTNQIKEYSPNNEFSTIGFSHEELPQFRFPTTLYFPGTEFTNKNGASPQRTQAYFRFAPQSPGAVQTEVIVQSKSRDSTISVILEAIGVAVARDTFAILNFSGTRNLSECLGDSSTMVVNIINSGNSVARIQGITFSNPIGEFNISPVISPATPLLVDPNETKPITIVWTAFNNGSRPITMSAITDRTDDVFIEPSFTVGTNPSPNVSFALTGGKNLSVGENIALSFDNEFAFLWGDLVTNDILIDFVYDKTLLAARNQLTLVPAIQSLGVTLTFDNGTDPTKDVYRMSAPAGVTVPVGKLATIDYSTFLPQRVLTETEKKNGINITPSITVTAASTNNCLKIATRATNITLVPTCAFGLNSVFSSGISYSLSTIKPDPVTDLGGTIGFSVGLHTPVLLEVFNSLGERVEILVNQELQPGSYEVILTTKALPTGMYSYKLSAGPYVATKPFILQK